MLSCLAATVAKSGRSVKCGREAAVHVPLTERLDFAVACYTGSRPAKKISS